MGNIDGLEQILNYAIESDNNFESGIDSVQIATARIEQGNLYKMLIEQDIFAGIQANPEVVNKVRSELVQFATIRLEMLLGIRQVNSEQKTTSAISLEEDEILVLKGLIAKIKEKEGLAANSPSSQLQTQQKSVGQLRPLHAPPQNTANAAPTLSSLSPNHKQKTTPTAPVVNTEPVTQTNTPKQLVQNTNTSNADFVDKKKTLQALKKQRDEILKKVLEKDNEWTEEESEEFRRISEKIEELSKQKAYAPLYAPKPSVDEENSISVYRADLLNKNLHTILGPKGD